MWEAPLRSSVYLHAWSNCGCFAPPAKLANAETPSSVAQARASAAINVRDAGLPHQPVRLAAHGGRAGCRCSCQCAHMHLPNAHISPVCATVFQYSRLARAVCARRTYMARRGMGTPLLCERTALTLTHSSVIAGARAASPVSAPTPKAAAPTPQRRAAKSPARAQPKAMLDDEGARADGAQKNSAKHQLERLQESHDALKQRCDALLLGLLVLTLLVVWFNYCTQTFFTNAYGRDAFCIFMALCFILSAENKESITALSKPRRYFLIFFGCMLFFELFPHAFPVWACALILMGCCAAYVLL